MLRNLIIVGLFCTLAGCSGFSDSRLNPANWFGRGQDEAAANYNQVPTDPALTDRRPLIGEVTSLEIERTAGGAIIRAEGLAPTQGYFGAELVPLAGETPVNGSLVYFFRVEPPFGATSQGPRRTRLLTVARFVPSSVLERAGSVVVRGQTNQRRSAR